MTVSTEVRLTVNVVKPAPVSVTLENGGLGLPATVGMIVFLVEVLSLGTPCPGVVVRALVAKRILVVFQKDILLDVGYLVTEVVTVAFMCVTGRSK